MRFLIKFSYIGTRYRGLQRDTSLRCVYDADTVQGAIECALSVIKPKLQEKPHFVLSSRTDVGVHALDNSGHVDLQTKYILKPRDLLIQANHFFNYCRHDIRFQSVIPVSNNFHCRADAKSRTYVYRFMIPKDFTDPSVPYIDSLYHYRLRLPTFDLEKAKEAANLFNGYHDFRTFCAEDLPAYKKAVRNLEICEIVAAQSLTPYDFRSKNYDYYTITFKSKGFLYNQVRRITAAILCCASGTISTRDIKIMLQVPGRENWNQNVHPLPAHGLQLVHVEYDPEDIEYYRLKDEELTNCELKEEEEEICTKEKLESSVLQTAAARAE